MYDFCYFVHYIDFTIFAGKGVSMSDAFDWDGLRFLEESAKKGYVHINLILLAPPREEDECAVLYENPIQIEED